MPIGRTLLAVVLFVSAVAAQAPRDAPHGHPPVVVRDVTLIDGTGAGPRPHATIRIRDGRIEAIVPSAPQGAVPRAATSDEPGARVIDGRGLFAIPGLVDAHVHLFGDERPRQVDALRRTLLGGVTTVWDLAGDDRCVAELGREAMAGEIVSPAIVHASLMAGPAFFEDPRAVASSAGFRPGEAPWARAVSADTDVVDAVAQALGTGPNAIKLYASLDSRIVHRLTAEAHRRGLRVVAHGTVFPARPSDLVDAGVDVLTHAAYLAWEGAAPSDDFRKRAEGDFAHVPPDAPAIVRLLETMRDRRVALNPTLLVFATGRDADPLKAARVTWGTEVTRRANQAGVRIVAGTDQMIGERDALPALHRELAMLVSSAGLTPLEALASATSNAAEAMGLAATRGALLPGRAADVVLLDANPADDIANTSRIRYVIKDGAVLREPSDRRTP